MNHHRLKAALETGTRALLSRYVLVPAAMLLAPLHADELPDGVRRISPSELRVERERIGESIAKRPVPQGIVDVNPPWLHVELPLPDRPKSARIRQEWQRRFFFKLSQDPQLKKDVIESGPKRWSFFSPLRTLGKGTWFWTYGVAPAESPDSPVWHDKVFSFVINGSEFVPPIPPTAEEVIAVLKTRKTGPIAICSSDDIGHMLPEKLWPELSRNILADANKALKDGERPVNIEFSDKDYPAYLGKNPKVNYFMVKLRAMFGVEERRRGTACGLAVARLFAHRRRSLQETWSPAGHRAGEPAADPEVFDSGKGGAAHRRLLLQYRASPDA